METNNGSTPLLGEVSPLTPNTASSSLIIMAHNDGAWMCELREAIRQRWEVGETFTASSIASLEPDFIRRHPGNNNVAAKLRQTLQFLRDEGLIEFVDNNGLYRRVGV